MHTESNLLRVNPNAQNLKQTLNLAGVVHHMKCLSIYHGDI